MRQGRRDGSPLSTDGRFTMARKPTYEELEQRVRELETRLSEEKIEWSILHHLSREWDAVGPPGIVDNRDLIAGLGITADQAGAVLEKLFKSGAIDKDAGGYASYLTPEGYTLAKNGRPDRPSADQLDTSNKQNQ